jgi:hypothetical protein
MILPGDTATTWDAIAPIVPQQAYLGGGTAIAVHLGHRVSRDLDFFFHHHGIDLDDLASRLSAVGPFAVTERSPGTLNGLFSSTKVQFLHADEGRPQHLLEQPQETDGLRIAGLSDLIAMKLKIARMALAAGARYGLALAGGYAVAAHGMGNRPSGDVDLSPAGSAAASSPN